ARRPTAPSRRPAPSPPPRPPSPPPRPGAGSRRRRPRPRPGAQQDLVDLPRRDLLAAPVDHLLEPPDQSQVAVGVEYALVAGAEPAVGEGRGVRLRVVGVAVDHARAADDHLAGAALIEQAAGLVHDPDLDPGAATHGS